MPRAPLRSCPVPGCPELTTGGRCPAHRRELDRAKRRRRGSTAARGYSSPHRQWREAVLARDPLCVACKAVRHVNASDTADHIVPLAWGGPPFDLANGQGLCAACHSVKSGHESRGRIVRVVEGQGLVVVGRQG